MGFSLPCPYFTHFRFSGSVIGRAIAADEDVSDDPKQWLKLDNGKVSKKHALISYDPDTQTYKLKCYGRNGIDCNRT